MIKKVEVTCCGNCPFSQLHSDLDVVICTELNEDIDEYFEEGTIPDHCPLIGQIMQISIKET